MRYNGIGGRAYSWSFDIEPHSKQPTEDFPILEFGFEGAKRLAEQHGVCKQAESVSTLDHFDRLLGHVQNLPKALRVEPLIVLFYRIGFLPGEDQQGAFKAWLYATEQRLENPESLEDFIRKSGPPMPERFGNDGGAARASELLGTFASASVVKNLYPNDEAYAAYLSTHPNAVLARRSELLNVLMQDVKELDFERQP